MKKKILKFGGSSLGSPLNIEKVLHLIKINYGEKLPVGIVVSAFGRSTDNLIEMSTMAAKSQRTYIKILDRFEQNHINTIKKLIHSGNSKPIHRNVKKVIEELTDTLHGVFLVKELSVKTLDFIMSFGERLSAYILSACLNDQGIQAEFCDTHYLIKTDDTFGLARVHLKDSYKKIQQYFLEHQQLQVITGFIGSTINNETTTLGRGGSDYTTVLIGAALKVAEIEIWTDVDGVMTADPRKVPKALPIDQLSYEEAMEMFHFGTKVIHPLAMHPAQLQNIPIRIRNIFKQDFQGTVIGKKTSLKYPIKGISSIDDIALLRVQGSGMIGVTGISGRLFNALTRNNISVILISQASSEHSICFAVSPKMAELAKKAIEQEFSLELLAKHIDRVIIERDLSIIAVVGENMRHKPGIAGHLFQSLGKNGINVVAIAQGSSELNISAVIGKQNESKALNALHETFFLSDTKTMHLFLIGTGLIGGTLIEQIEKQKRYLLESNALDMKMIALGNIEKMVFNENGIPLRRWEKELDQKGKPVNLQQFVDQIIKLNLPNTIFIDCTGSEEVVDHYEGILRSNISIVTPNKIANSGKYRQYRRLKEAAMRHGVKFLYETNVGAGLPIISTLNDLMSSGDQILRIEAILSGTLSYIFNTLSKEKKLSAVVKEAQKRGLSEPDPREDLKGIDVARKILILGREIGLSMEMKDIRLNHILPAECYRAKSVEKFFQELEKEDLNFEELRMQAEKKGKVLRYIATIENSKAWISLREIDSQHPFYTLSGSDNMIVLTTKRYYERPFVIKGPGAGAEVTAAGVFADIIRISNYLK